MYQDRSEDLDPRVSNVLNDGPKISEALEKINKGLENLYKIKEDGVSEVGIRYNPDPYRNRTYRFIDPDEHPEDWDYSKEYKESLQKLNEVVLDAYIVFLECEREALIKRWNDMAKDLKPEKK